MVVVVMLVLAGRAGNAVQRLVREVDWIARPGFSQSQFGNAVAATSAAASLGETIEREYNTSRLRRAE